MTRDVLIYLVAGLATFGVILRPFGLPEAIWACAGASALVALQLLAPGAAVAGVARGVDVYLFLAGMMLLAETAKDEGLFDWLAALAAGRAEGSPKRLFLSVYVVGAIVTILLSNDATAVVLTPAVAAAARKAKSSDPLPYLYICAFIANAASFVLPISNPANLVVYGAHMPTLLHWLELYLAPSAAAVAATYAALRFAMRGALQGELASDVARPVLSRGGRVAAIGVAATGAILLAASALGLQLGLPTAVAGCATLFAASLCERRWPARAIRGVSWSVLALVAGLFVIVQGLDATGLIGQLGRRLAEGAAASGGLTAFIGAWIVAAASNVMNNLPVGLIAGAAVQSAHPPETAAAGVLIGVDLGPNFSVTGSLATILWLNALRREGLRVSALNFLKLGAIVTPPALLTALGALLILARYRT